MTLITGDCRLMPKHGPFDLIIADPPYGDTSLTWVRRVSDWLPLVRTALRPTGSLWLFGSLRFLLGISAELRAAGLCCAQEIVWEKQNGKGFQADRFKRVHELVAQFYSVDAPWSTVYNIVQVTPDAAARAVLRRHRPRHAGKIGPARYVRREGGARLMRSVLYLRNAHGYAIHPTEKSVALFEVLVRTSYPEGGLVGDWFAGSGAAAEACRLTGRRYLGCEIDPVMADKARDRIVSVLPFGGGAVT